MKKFDSHEILAKNVGSQSSKNPLLIWKVSAFFATPENTDSPPFIRNHRNLKKNPRFPLNPEIWKVPLFFDIPGNLRNHNKKLKKRVFWIRIALFGYHEMFENFKHFI